MPRDRDARKIAASRDYKGWLTGNHNRPTEAECANDHRILKRIRTASHDLPPSFVGLEFVRYVRDKDDFAWALYVSHDPCHDGFRHGKAYIDDRNTVVAIHRTKGVFKILGRELSREHALQIARGEV